MGRWKGKGERNVEKSIYIYFKVNVKNNYKKIGKKNDNEVDADLA